MKVKCQCCQKEFEKNSSQVKKSPNHYCSRSCAAKINNKINPKRKPEGSCFSCEQPTNKRRKYCASCFEVYFRNDYQKILLKDFLCEGKTRAAIYARIRESARRQYIFPNSSCVRCKYAIHVECCHIKPISSFPSTTTIAEINHESNIIILCRNCHWELDHGLWSP